MRPLSLRNHQAARYTQVGLETRVNSASAEGLVALLLDAALADIARARLFFAQDDTAHRGASISHAIEIVRGGLIAALDDSQGAVAARLRDAYELSIHWLLQATVQRDAAKLDPAEAILRSIREAWAAATSAHTPS